MQGQRYRGVVDNLRIGSRGRVSPRHGQVVRACRRGHGGRRQRRH